MLTCSETQTRILGLADPAKSPENVRVHLDQCHKCQQYLAKLTQIERWIQQIPVPSSNVQVKETFIESITQDDGLIIRHVPTVPRRDSAVNLPRLLLENGRWGYSLGVAAALAIAFMGWWMTIGRSGKPEFAKASAPRHELLNREIRHIAALSNTNLAEQRMAIWAEFTQDLTEEAQLVSRAATTEDMTALVQMIDKAVTQGVLGQADRLPVTMTPAERMHHLRQSAKVLEAAEKQAVQLTREPPAHAEPALKKIANTVSSARAELLRRAGGA